MSHFNKKRSIFVLAVRIFVVILHKIYHNTKMSLVKKNFIKQVFVLVLLGWGVNTTTLAQNEITRKPSVSTNLIDWMLVVPNVGVEIPLSNPQYVNGSSLFVEGKASLNANRVYAPDMNYKLFSGKVEYRRHFRFGEDMKYTINGEYRNANDSVIYLNMLDSLSWMIRATNAVAEKVTGKKYWSNRRRAHVDDLGRSYVGVFAQYADYSMCLPLFNYNRGRMGQAGIVGVSLGYQKPFYNFSNRFYLEWEMGGSLGCVVTQFDKYNRYESNIVGSGNWYYPMITDLHVSLVLRKHSVKDLYKKKPQVGDFTSAQIEKMLQEVEERAELERLKEEKAKAKENQKIEAQAEKERKQQEKETQKEEEEKELEILKQEKEAKKKAKAQKAEENNAESVDVKVSEAEQQLENLEGKAKKLTKEEKEALKMAEKAEKERLKMEQEEAKKELKQREEAEKAKQKLEKENQKLEKKKAKEQLEK